MMKNNYPRAYPSTSKDWLEITPMARNERNILPMGKSYINKTYPRALHEGEGECHSPLHIAFSR